MFSPLRTLPAKAPYKKGDVMVVFGELFSRGYANGLVEEAERQGVTVIYSTVGRREGNELRALTPEELELQPKPFINVPMEAGFDMETDSTGLTPCDHLKGYKMSEWQDVRLDWKLIDESRKKGRERFITSTEKYVQELEKLIPPGANVLFAHIMAGGVPRAKILMPVMNKVFKGRDDRHLSSEEFLNSDLGKLGIQNFEDVTANTYKYLIEGTAALREKLQSQGGNVAYLAYGYHGTEVLHGSGPDAKFKWQTYTPYFQGWAKMLLEKISQDFAEKGGLTCVFNCPEILTNSSSIFQGVEVSLYPMLGALDRKATPYIKKVLADCKKLLKPTHNFKEIMNFTGEYFENPLITSHSSFEKWPQHNSREQMSLMLDSSEHLIDMHEDPKQLMTAVLSEEVFKSTGTIMFHESFKPAKPVLWLGHDILAEQMSLIK
jgi:hypothetical protein